MNGNLSHPWDSFNAYLFDIDGTLINSPDATHYFAFCAALKLLSGRELNLEGVSAHGNVDTGILRDALVLAGVPELDWRPRLAEAHACMAEYVDSHYEELRPTVLPYVTELLEYLRAGGAKLSVATGNIERVGRRKLERASLMQHFDFADWSDAHENRADVFQAAVAQARKLCGKGATVCIVGDTPLDIRAAHENGVPVIAVATGIYSFDSLKEERPELCLHSFEDLFQARLSAK
jgi:phosphoglycolate phosphatase-like HAD superfamily hydrolase